MAARGSYKSYLQESTTEIPRSTQWRKAPKLRTAPPPTPAAAGPPTVDRDFEPDGIDVVCQQPIDSSPEPPQGGNAELLCGKL